MLFAGERQKTSLLRADVRQDQKRLEGLQVSGGDFYAPFWSDVKDHVAGVADLHDSSQTRMERNARRERLYPILTKGFLTWWDQHRRWTNEPFELVRTPSTTFVFDKNLTIRLDNFLSVKDSKGVSRFIYPYFYDSPALRNEAARVGLWVIKQSFPGLRFEHFRILDVPRGRIFSPDRCYLEGDEEDILRVKYQQLWNLYVSIEEGSV